MIGLESAPVQRAVDLSLFEPDIGPVADYPRFEYSMKEVKRAGEVISGGLPWTPETQPVIRHAFMVANNWRDAHAYPMRSVRYSLLARMRADGLKGISAARLKRMQAIRRKLRRMAGSLNQLQDLGGCRIVLSSIDEVHALVDAIHAEPRHDLWDEDNYIALPKADGYRSHHLMFKFRGRNELAATHNGRRIEVQLRTRLQHSWATAVEGVGLFRNEDLKGNQGSPEWLRLFLLMSAEFAEIEGCPATEGVPSRADRIREIQELDTALGAINTLENLRHAVDSTDIPLAPGYKPTHFLIRYDTDTKTVYVEPHNAARAAVASYDLAEAKDNQSGLDTENVVLVEVDKLENLKTAYPNYFGDVELFKNKLIGITNTREAREFRRLPRPKPIPQPVEKPAKRGWLWRHISWD
jgi:ppGpp synthetase/RelA/SpoT-type nucleotidyltranferase